QVPPEGDFEVQTISHGSQHDPFLAVDLRSHQRVVNGKERVIANEETRPGGIDVFPPIKPGAEIDTERSGKPGDRFH
ncbi:MAG: hypothetical protein AMK69_26150, partial [Nitrospira bacterium SG8_3]